MFILELVTFQYESTGIVFNETTKSIPAIYLSEILVPSPVKWFANFAVFLSNILDCCQT